MRTSMLLSKALIHIHLHHDIHKILTIPYEHSKSPTVQLLILNELDGAYFFLSHLNGGLKNLSKVAGRIQLRDSSFNVIWYVYRYPTITETKSALKYVATSQCKRH